MQTDIEPTEHTNTTVGPHGLTPTPSPTRYQPFIDTKTLRGMLGVSVGTIEAWRRAGKLPFVRMTGRKILFHWPSVEAAILRMQRGGGVQ